MFKKVEKLKLKSWEQLDMYLANTIKAFGSLRYMRNSRYNLEQLGTSSANTIKAFSLFCQVIQYLVVLGV